MTASRKPAIARTVPHTRNGEIARCCAPNQPKTSISNPMTICPVTGMITVLKLPNFGNSNTLPVRNVTPNTPASHIHHGPSAAVADNNG